MKAGRARPETGPSAFSSIIVVSEADLCSIWWWISPIDITYNNLQSLIYARYIFVIVQLTPKQKLAYAVFFTATVLVTTTEN